MSPTSPMSRSRWPAGVPREGFAVRPGSTRRGHREAGGVRRRDELLGAGLALGLTEPRRTVTGRVTECAAASRCMPGASCDASCPVDFRGSLHGRHCFLLRGSWWMPSRRRGSRGGRPAVVTTSISCRFLSAANPTYPLAARDQSTGPASTTLAEPPVAGRHRRAASAGVEIGEELTSRSSRQRAPVGEQPAAVSLDERVAGDHQRGSSGRGAGTAADQFLSLGPGVALRRTVGMMISGTPQLVRVRESTWSWMERARPAAGGRARRPWRRLGDARRAGRGKTALLEYAVEAGQGYHVARTSGVEGEMELPFAALQQLCSPFLELDGAAPAAPARRAWRRVRLDRRAGSEPVPRWTGGPGTAVRGRGGPAAVDCRRRRAMARWRVGARSRFVARRLLAEKIALVFATRELGDTLTRLPELHVEPLGHRDARALLESACRHRWMSACSTGSSTRRAVIRSRCSSCRAG